MSKMPPQGSCSIPQIVDLFFSHLANIKKPHLILSKGEDFYFKLNNKFKALSPGV